MFGTIFGKRKSHAGIEKRVVLMTATKVGMSIIDKSIDSLIKDKKDSDVAFTVGELKQLISECGIKAMVMAIEK